MTEEVNIQTIDSAPVSSGSRVFKDLFAGTVGGIAQVLSGQPFDTVKVRIQSSPEGTFTGAGDVVQKLIKNEGLTAFYKGSTVPLCGVGACVSVQFGVNEFMKRFFANYHLRQNKPADTPLTAMQFYASGAAGGFASGFLASPIEHIRIRLQTSDQFKGPIDCFKKVKLANGYRGVFKGLVPTLVRESHGIGIYFLTFEALVKDTMLRNNIKRSDIPGWKLCSFGAAAGYALWLTVYPIDVVKSKMQADSLSNPRYRNTLQVAKEMWLTSGFKGFFRGFFPTMLRAAPANAATFYAFELTMRVLG